MQYQTGVFTMLLHLIRRLPRLFVDLMNFLLPLVGELFGQVLILLFIALVLPKIIDFAFYLWDLFILVLDKTDG